MARLNLTDCINDLHPPPPICFYNKSHWIEYLQSAAASQYHKGEQKVIILVNSEPAFNYEFDFCEDCTDEAKTRMKKDGRCNPDALKTHGVDSEYFQTLIDEAPRCY